MPSGIRVGCPLRTDFGIGLLQEGTASVKGHYGARIHGNDGVRFLAALTLFVAIAGVPATLQAQDTGRVTGQLSDSKGQGIAGVAVQLVELKMAEIADDEGRFVLHDVRAGTYTIVFTLGDPPVVEAGVQVQAGMTTTIDKKVDWALSFAETITVNGVSRRPAPIG